MTDAIFEQIVNAIRAHKNHFKVEPRYLIVSPDVLAYLQAKSPFMDTKWNSLHYMGITVAVIETKNLNKMEVL